MFGEAPDGCREKLSQRCWFRRCYSVACTGGELGEVDVSTIRCLVSRGFFERLKEHTWQA